MMLITDFITQPLIKGGNSTSLCMFLFVCSVCEQSRYQTPLHPQSAQRAFCKASVRRPAQWGLCGILVFKNDINMLSCSSTHKPKSLIFSRMHDDSRADTCTLVGVCRLQGPKCSDPHRSLLPHGLRKNHLSLNVFSCGGWTSPLY